VQSDVLGATALDRQQFSFHVTRDLGWATFKSVSSYQTWNLGPNFTDLDLSNFGISTSDIQQNQDYMTSRYSLTSDQTQDLRWQLGLFRSETESDGVAARSFPVPLPPTFMTTGPDTQTTSFNSEREIYAFYGNVSKDLSDRLTIEAGGRIEYVDTELSRSKGSAVYGPLGSFSGQTDDWYFSPTLGLSYKASEDVTLFGRTSIGIKPAGFTAFSDNPATSAYGEETAWETEAGVRLDRPEENWDLELRGYYKQIDDYQLNRSVLNSTDFIILNANEVRAIGVEAEANWKPSDKLSIAASAGWSQVEFEKFNDGTTDFGGNRVPFVPEFSAALGLRYDIGNGFFVSSSYRSIGSTTYEETGNANFKQASYQILDAQIGYEAENWSASVFGHNLLDEDYFSYLSPQIAAGSPGTPALYGVRVSVEF
jgi:iron complex outermembrane receptor protein